MRIEDERCGCSLLAQPIEEMIDQGGLASSHFPGEQKKSFTVLNAVRQLIEGLLNARGSVQEPRVGIYVERIRAKSKEALVHGCSVTTPDVVSSPFSRCRTLAIQLLDGGPSQELLRVAPFRSRDQSSASSS